ncbi:hypothetical protein [Rubripirellula tenax]|nr:hypothetical protein [Rubripirellula tenax]
MAILMCSVFAVAGCDSAGPTDVKDSASQDEIAEYKAMVAAEEAAMAEAAAEDMTGKK